MGKTCLNSQYITKIFRINRGKRPNPVSLCIYTTKLNFLAPPLTIIVLGIGGWKPLHSPNRTRLPLSTN